MTQTIVIDPNYCGPPDSANGGYVCGLLAGLLEGTAEVTLRRPPPLGKELTLETEVNGVFLRDGDQLIASARSAILEIDVPPPIPEAEAETASRHYIGFKEHPFPTCYVCGPERKAGDGLHIFAGRVDAKDLFAAPWTPDAPLADERGWVRPEFIWAALDCPGAFVVMGDRQRKVVLGRLTARVERPIRAGERCVVLGWPLGREGRKDFCGTVVYNEAGTRCALAKAIWFEID